MRMAIHSSPGARFTRQLFVSPSPRSDFYESLLGYLRDGYNLAEACGQKGRALGFVMTIFQKIAASSFAAVGTTLRRAIADLTVHEAIVCDQKLDEDVRERAFSDARRLYCTRCLVYQLIPLIVRR